MTVYPSDGLTVKSVRDGFRGRVLLLSGLIGIWKGGHFPPPSLQKVLLNLHHSQLTPSCLTLTTCSLLYLLNPVAYHAISSKGVALKGYTHNEA